MSLYIEIEENYENENSKSKSSYELEKYNSTLPTTTRPSRKLKTHKNKR